MITKFTYFLTESLFQISTPDIVEMGFIIEKALEKDSDIEYHHMNEDWIILELEDNRWVEYDIFNKIKNESDNFEEYIKKSYLTQKCFEDNVKEINDNSIFAQHVSQHIPGIVKIYYGPN